MWWTPTPPRALDARRRGGLHMGAGGKKVLAHSSCPLCVSLLAYLPLLAALAFFPPRCATMAAARALFRPSVGCSPLFFSPLFFLSVADGGRLPLPFFFPRVGARRERRSPFPSLPPPMALSRWRCARAGLALQHAAHKGSAVRRREKKRTRHDRRGSVGAPWPPEKKKEKKTPHKDEAARGRAQTTETD